MASVDLRPPPALKDDLGLLSKQMKDLRRHVESFAHSFIAEYLIPTNESFPSALFFPTTIEQFHDQLQLSQNAVHQASD
jgi:hypothetical protein